MQRLVGLGTLWGRLPGRVMMGSLTDQTSRRCVHDVTSKKTVFREFEQYLKHGDPTTDQTPLFKLLRHCSYGMKMEQPEGRVQVAKQMWADLTQSGFKKDVALHNALLQVYLANRHPFSPSEFMEEMNATGLLPNQGTLVLLLDAYCQQGNLTGAHSILQHMNEKGYTINEHVYASLISGHAQSGDMEGAWKMIDVMQENGLDPGTASYIALLGGHARLGQLDEMRDTLRKMAEKRMYPSHSVYIAIIDELSLGGHHALIPEVLDMIKSKKWMLSDLLQLAQTCASRGEHESSMKLLDAVLHLPGRAQIEHIQLKRASEVIFKHMLLLEKPVEWLLENLRKMTLMDCVSGEMWERLLAHLYRKGDPGIIITALTEMQRKGFRVKRHYVYPALAIHANQCNTSGLKECLCFLHDLNLGIDENVVRILLRAVGSDRDGVRDLVQLIEESRLVEDEEEKKKLITIVCDTNPHILPDVAKELGMSAIQLDFLYPSLVDHCGKQRPNVSGLARIFKLLHSASPHPPMTELTKCIEDCAALLFQNSPAMMVQSFVKSLLNAGVEPLTDDTYAYAVSASGRNKELIEVLSKHSVPIADLRQQRKVLTKGMEERHNNNRVIDMAKARRPDEVLKVYRIMVNKGHTPSHMAASCVVSALVETGEIDEANELKRDLQRKGWVTNQFVWNAYIRYYSQRGDVENAKLHYKQMVDSGTSPSYFSVQCLMEAYAFHGDVPMVKELMDVERVKHGLQVSSGMVTSLMDAHVYHNNIEEAVQIAEQATEKPFLGCLVNLVTLLVKRKAKVAEGKKEMVDGNEDELIEQVKDVMRSPKYNVDINNVMLDAFLENGFFEEAHKLASVEEFELKPVEIDAFCRSMAAAGKTESILAAIQLLEEKGMDTNFLNVSLLRSYIFLGDLVSILELQKKLEAEGQRFTPEFYTVLARYLRLHGMEPPPPPPPVDRAGEGVAKVATVRGDQMPTATTSTVSL